MYKVVAIDKNYEITKTILSSRVLWTKGYLPYNVDASVKSLADRLQFLQN